MHVDLIPYPGLPHPELAIWCEISRRAGNLRVTYHSHGNLANILVPAPAAPGRADGLWRSTCFEMFVKPSDRISYREFNISPSEQWASYRLDTYREGIRPSPMEPLDGVCVRQFGPDLEVGANYELGREDEAFGQEDWFVGLSAVIEARDGSLSYWALAHPDPDKPDFHHPDCFVLELPAPRAP